MKLLLDILRLLAGKFLAVLVLATAIIGATFLWTWTREQRGLQDRIASLRLDVDAARRDLQNHRVRALNLEMQFHRLEDTRPNPVLHPSDYLEWRAKMQAAEAAVAAARNARDRAKSLLDDAQQRLFGLEGQIDTTLENLIHTARRTWWTLALAIAVFLFGPLAWKGFWYYGIAPIAANSPPMHVLPAEAPGSCCVTASGKAIEIQVEPDSPLLTRMEWLQQYAPNLAKRTRFLLDWRYPFISYASGLREMTEVAVKPGQIADRAVLTSADDPNAYLVAIQLDNHPGIVLKPGVVVAIRGAIILQSRWRLGNLHAWISGRLRHILFSGTGTLYLTGHGGVEWISTTAPVVVEEALVLGYDGRAAFATDRTETFWPYFRDRTSLFDYRFPGGQAFLRQTAAPLHTRVASNPFMRTVNAVLNAVGKVLGF